MYIFNKSNITILQTENYIELAYSLKTNGNTKCHITYLLVTLKMHLIS